MRYGPGAGEARGTEVRFPCAPQAGGAALGGRAMTFPRKRLVQLFANPPPEPDELTRVIVRVIPQKINAFSA
jgi:hypothetical protein